ncbi:hypothetical protein [Oceanimonas smirnovii]|uniref:hypothetical protein n=1 Tax=Oceanimonas smirnovii TaxID=264574 RepID=UPI003FD3C895
MTTTAEAKKTAPSAAKKLTPVSFIKAWGRYVKGDIAGFQPEEAERLIKTIKVAEAYKG